MKKELVLLIVGLILAAAGALLKIQKVEAGQYVLIAGLVIEAYALISLVLKSLKK